MALVVVLWVVAALSIMVGSLVATVRGEVRTAAQQRESVQALGAGQAAIALALQQIVAARPSASGWLEVLFNGTPISVEVYPVDGLVDLANAPEPLLAALYGVLGGVPPDAATALARETVSLRQQRDALGRPAGLEAPEDLFRIPGFPYGAYASISRFVYVARTPAGGLVNPMAAPEAVLLVLAEGNAAAAQRIAAARQRGEAGIDITALNPRFLAATVGRLFRLVAEVPVGEGQRIAVVQTVELQTPRPNEAPWRILDTDRYRLPALLGRRSAPT